MERVLPVDVLHAIFMQLDGPSLQSVACVCRTWHMALRDDWFWAHKITHDKDHWRVMSVPGGRSRGAPIGGVVQKVRRLLQLGHDKRDKSLRVARADVPSRSRYIQLWRCTTGQRVSNRMFWMPPEWTANFMRTVMLMGPGMDGSGFVRTLLWNREVSPFEHVDGMTPGHMGVGSGFSVRCSGMSLNIVALYPSTEAERTANQGGPLGGAGSRLVNACTNGGARTVCNRAHGYIYVTGRLPTETEMEEFQHALAANTTAPVLVLIVPNISRRLPSPSDTPTITCTDMITHLGLVGAPENCADGGFSAENAGGRPWLFMQTKRDSMYFALRRGIGWLLGTSISG